MLYLKYLINPITQAYLILNLQVYLNEIYHLIGKENHAIKDKS
jgi:hypothetical protein